MPDPESPADAQKNSLTCTSAALEAQRDGVGSALVEAAPAPLLAQLNAHKAALPRRRQVSVLFLDVVDSSALSENADPEETHDIIDSALQSFTARVVQQGGKVLQYAGDSLLAAFGTETAREDDAERAVHAELDLLAEARVQAARVQRAHGRSGFGMRIGVHTGHVLLGGGVDEEGTIRGFTVNLAARLEQAAPPGSLRISQETWRHVRGVFEFEAQAPLQVKGQVEPLRTYLVLRTKPRAFRVATRGIEGAETPLVGRDADLAQLMAAFEGTARTRSLRAVPLLAEAGFGKSRLMQELRHRLELHAQGCWLLPHATRCRHRSTFQAGATAGVDVRAYRLQLADTWRQQGEVAKALAIVEAELPALNEAGALDTTRAPLLARMAGWRVLNAAGDARAPRQLELAVTELQRRAEKVSDPAVRQRMLEGLPLHREITAAWNARPT